MKRASAAVAWIIACLMAAAAGAIFLLSLNHPITADLAMLHYSAWLINEHGVVLYRDLFELNFPLPFLFHSLLGAVLGYEPFPLRLVDLALLLLLGGIAMHWLAPVSRAAALFGTALFTVLYLFQGGEFVLEREFLGLVPAMAAVALATAGRPLASGIALALACGMKPNFVVLVPAVLAFSAQARAPGTPAVRSVATWLAAAAVTGVLPFAWVWQQGGLEAFLAIYRDFLPIYSNSRQDLFHYNSDSERLALVAREYLKYGGLSLMLSLPGLAWAWWNTAGQVAARRRLVQLAAVTVSITFYEVIAGKFWFNHLFPTMFCTALCIGLLLAPCASNARYGRVPALLLAWAAALAVAWQVTPLGYQAMQAAHEQENRQPGAWRARAIAEVIRQANLPPGETVQVLDMAGDGQAALLLAQVPSATRHLIDVPLYMQPHADATQALRAEFVAALEQHPPAMVVYVHQFLHPGGGNRLREFAALSRLLERDYVTLVEDEGRYTIFRRRY